MKKTLHVWYMWGNRYIFIREPHLEYDSNFELSFFQVLKVVMYFIWILMWWDVALYIWLVRRTCFLCKVRTDPIKWKFICSAWQPAWKISVKGIIINLYVSCHIRGILGTESWTRYNNMKHMVLGGAAACYDIFSWRNYHTFCQLIVYKTDILIVYRFTKKYKWWPH